MLTNDDKNVEIQAVKRAMRKNKNWVCIKDIWLYSVIYKDI